MNFRHRARSILPALAGALSATVAPAQVMHPTCPQVTLTIAHIGAAPDMQFSVHQVAGHKVMFAEGGVTARTPANLAAALARSGAVDEIWIRSGGGDAQAGNDAARILRKSGIPVRIPSGWWCISACNFLFFGGAIRQIDDGGEFGVHMATLVNDENYQNKLFAREKAAIAVAKANKQPSTDSKVAVVATQQTLARIAEREQSMALLTADDIDVVLRMGISRKLLSEVMYAQRADDFRDDDGDGKLDMGKVPVFRCLTQAEMRRYNVVNTD